MPYVSQPSAKRTSEGHVYSGAHLEVHRLQLLAPLDQKRRADVQMELRERVGALRLGTCACSATE